MIAVAFPKAEFVVIKELKAIDPFCALPKVERGNDESQRAAVVSRQRVTEQCVCQEILLFVEIEQGKVGRITAIGMDKDVCGFRAERHVAQKFRNSDATPGDIKFGPLRDAVDVVCQRTLLHLHELIPTEASFFSLAPNTQSHVLRFDVWGRAVGEYWKPFSERLSAWDACILGFLGSLEHYFRL